MMDTRFIADTMLGKLAKWMRLLGCDVEYFPSIPDDELVERADRSRRLILTRDTLLIRRRKARENHFFVLYDGYKDQLRQVVRAFSIDPESRVLTRCLLCNEPLDEIEKSAAAARVPPYVYRTQETFVTCRSCRRIYWKGTHREAVERQLKEILGAG
ncbi:MAG: Mut7-C RNAse domain-containing protein [Deltaproteobacteria bacterium]|nr:Mut7-C RNAse domain-containing protein [Deltaproteobacteria bacterium]